MLIVAFQMEQHSSFFAVPPQGRQFLSQGVVYGFRRPQHRRRVGLSRVLMQVKIPAAEIPPGQYQDMNWSARNTERTSLLIEREDLNAPLPSSRG